MRPPPRPPRPPPCSPLLHLAPLAQVDPTLTRADRLVGQVLGQVRSRGLCLLPRDLPACLARSVATAHARGADDAGDDTVAKMLEETGF